MTTISKRVLKYTSEQDYDDAEASICSLLGIPNDNGTVRWSDKKSQDGYWYMSYPIKGWNSFSTQQVLNVAGNYEDCEIDIEIEDV